MPVAVPGGGSLLFLGVFSAAIGTGWDGHRLSNVVFIQAETASQADRSACVGTQ